MLAWLTLRPAGPILVAPCLLCDGLNVGQLAGESVTEEFFGVGGGKIVLNEPPTRTVDISSRLELSCQPVHP